MVLVSAIRMARKEGMPLGDAIKYACDECLRTIIMTALVASVGFVPMAISSGAGAEVQRPLATVVIGGVMTSTLFTVIVLPVFYSLFGSRFLRPKRRKLELESQPTAAVEMSPSIP